MHKYICKLSSLFLANLFIADIPETRLEGIPTTDIEDLKDTVAIRCVVTANPKASVVWRREGQNQPASLQELLQFSPAIRQHSGLYTCHARNKAGDSQPIRVHVDVKCEYIEIFGVYFDFRTFLKYVIIWFGFYCVERYFKDQKMVILGPEDDLNNNML